ncbi:hypothetical protein [Corynebacterium amycolatum]|uniref:hypothetical protein n=1 Tax=Corynebacterium amycolatum TaxID=43765 RepID=UPI00191E34C2|nr:hypothetical protein [Corynebacterium amycolatum]QQU97762.1 hypothetical protein I6I65_10595 [Corynebacterium amycolatum]
MSQPMPKVMYHFLKNLHELGYPVHVVGASPTSYLRYGLMEIGPDGQYRVTERGLERLEQEEVRRGKKAG